MERGDQDPETNTGLSYTGGVSYNFDFSDGTRIAPKAATIEIASPEAGNTIDTLTRITAITIGRETGITLNTIVIPEGGLAVTGAPAAPAITLDPAIVPVKAATDTAEHSVTVTGANFADTAPATLTAVDATDSAVDLNDGASVTVIADNITNGAFTQVVTFAPQTSAAKITITAAQNGQNYTAEFNAKHTSHLQIC